MNTGRRRSFIKMPKVSVVIPTYNRAHLLSGAINSVLNQTFNDLEIIVIDDGSTDNTRGVLEQYGSGINYIYQQRGGRGQVRNTGIKAAKGDYIAFLDDDDIWLPEKLEKQVKFLDANPDIGLAHTFVELIDAQGYPLKEATKKQLQGYKKAAKTGYTYETMSRSCLMFTSTVIVRKECFDKVGFFDPGLEAFEDWDFYLRFALEYRIGTILEPLVRFRIHEAHSTMDEFTRGRIKVSIKHLNMLKAGSNFSYPGRLRYNFYMHLANAYYIDMQFAIFRSYALKALKSRPLALFVSRIGLHFAVSFIPDTVITVLRKGKALFFKKPRLYSQRIIPEEAYGGPLAAHLKRYDFVKRFSKDKVILDAACGAGYGAHYLADAVKEVSGVDISEEAITYAKEHYKEENIHFRVMDVYKLEFPDKYFDLACSFEALEHLDKPEKFLWEIKRVLKKNGVFVFSTPNVKETNHNPENPYHKIEFCRKDLEGILKKYFVNIEIFGQRRRQSSAHYYLQKIDIFHLRAVLPDFLRRVVCHAVATRSWSEAGLGDFVISKERIDQATELIGICKVEGDPK